MDGRERPPLSRKALPQCEGAGDGRRELGIRGVERQNLIGRDEPYIRMLKSEIDRFNEELDALTEKLVRAGATRVAA